MNGFKFWMLLITTLVCFLAVTLELEVIYHKQLEQDIKINRTDSILVRYTKIN